MTSEIKTIYVSLPEVIKVINIFSCNYYRNIFSPQIIPNMNLYIFTKKLIKRGKLVSSKRQITRDMLETNQVGECNSIENIDNSL